MRFQLIPARHKTHVNVIYECSHAHVHTHTHRNERSLKKIDKLQRSPGEEQGEEEEVWSSNFLLHLKCHIHSKFKIIYSDITQLLFMDEGEKSTVILTSVLCLQAYFYSPVNRGLASHNVHFMNFISSFWLLKHLGTDSD